MTSIFRTPALIFIALTLSSISLKANAIYARYICETNWTGVAGSLSNMGMTCRIVGYSGGLSGGGGGGFPDPNPGGGGGGGGDSAPPPSEKYCAGNPILISSGHKFQHTVDLVGKNSLLSVERYYSQSRTEVTLVGRKWAMGFDYALDFTFSGEGEIQGVTLIRPDGDNLTLVYQVEEGSWHHLNGQFAHFGFAEEGQIWVYQSPEGVTENYDVDGNITSRLNMQKQGVFYHYDNDELTAITSSNGDILTLGYNDAGLISSIDFNGSEFEYDYVNGDFLGEVHLPDGTKYGFEYTDARHAGALTQKNVNDILYARWKYDDEGRGVLSEHANGAERTEFSYDADSTTVTNALGKKTTYSFSTINGKRVPTTISGEEAGSCIAANKTYTYDDYGNQDIITDWQGNMTDYDYNHRGLLLSETKALGTAEEQTTAFEWHPILPLPLKRTTDNVITEFSYDDNHRVVEKKTTSRTTGQTRSWTFEYELYDNGSVKELRENGPLEGEADITLKAYDRNGNLLSITNALGHTITFGDYDAFDNPGYQRDINGIKTKFKYDNVGRLVESKEQSDPKTVTRFVYNAMGQLIEKEDERSGKTTFAYDEAYRKIGTTNALGDSLNVTLDAAGNITQKIISEDHNPWQFSDCEVENTRPDCNSGEKRLTEALYSAKIEKAFDALSRVTSVSRGGEQLSHYHYDANNNLVEATDGNGNLTSYEYDALNRKVSETSPDNQTTYYQYDSLNQITAVTDARGNQTRYRYNDFGDLIQIDSPDSGVSVFTYNEAGQKTSLTRADGTLLTYHYDALNRLLTTSVEGKVIYHYSYDDCKNGVGRLCAVTDLSGKTEYTYHKTGQLDKKTVTIQGHRYTINHTYDKAGRLKNMQYPSGVKVKYAYDDIGNVTDITVKGKSLLSDITYKPMGPVKGWMFGNGQQRAIQYDNQLNIQRILSTHVQDLRYQYDVVGNITSLENKRYDRFYNYGYDFSNRLTGIVGSDFQAYEYDSLGNRLSKNAFVAVDSYEIASDSNRLLSVQRGYETRTFGYDANGNIISDEAASVSKQFLYNAENRMVMTTVNGKTTTYAYNAHGKRVSKVLVNGTQYNYLYDAAGQLIAESKNGEVTKEYFYLNGQLVGLYQNKNLYFVHTDHLGRPEIVTDKHQHTVWRADNKAFGREVLLDSIDGMNIGFPGQYWDEEKLSWYNGFRDYDSSIGRYLQSDPIGVNGGINTYNYVLSNPLSLTDLLGLLPKGGLTPELDVPIADRCQKIFDSGLASLRSDGLLDGHNILFDPRFAAAKLDSKGAIIPDSEEFFPDEFKAHDFVMENDGYQLLNGSTVLGSSNSVIYAGATLPSQGYKVLDSGKIRTYNFTAAENIKFVIMHEIAHGKKIRLEGDANKFAFDALGF